MVANLPLILPLLKHWLESVIGSVSLLQTPKSSCQLRTSFRTIGGGNGSPGLTAKLGRRAIPSANAMPTNLTICTSEEHIVGESISIHDMVDAGGHGYDDHLPDDLGISVSYGNRCQVLA